MAGKNFYSPALGGQPVVGESLAGIPLASQFFALNNAAACSPFVATVATLVTTPAQIRSGLSSPIAFVAGVAGFKHIPLVLGYSRNQTPNVNYVTAQTWSVYYANSLANALTQNASPNLTNVTGAAISTGHTNQSTTFGPTATGVGGQALVLKASVDCTLGGPDVLWFLVYVTVPVAAGT